MVSIYLQCRRPGFSPWVGKIWRRKWQSTPVFLSGKSHRRRNLVGYSPWGHKESDTTKRLHFLSFFHFLWLIHIYILFFYMHKLYSFIHLNHIYICIYINSCPTLCHPMDCSLPGSSVHGDSPGKNTGVGCYVLLRGFSQPRDRTQVSHIAGEFFTIWATRGA